MNLLTNQAEAQAIRHHRHRQVILTMAMKAMKVVDVEAVGQLGLVRPHAGQRREPTAQQHAHTDGDARAQREEDGHGRAVDGRGGGRSGVGAVHRSRAS